MSGSKINIDFSEEWEKLPWKKFQITLFRLQKRLFKAVREGNMVKANDLQRLILKSRAARFLAIRQVTRPLAKVFYGMIKGCSISSLNC